MNKLLFACYDKTHLEILLPLFSFLQKKDYKLSLLNRASRKIPENKVKGITVFDPPEVDLKKIKKQALFSNLTFLLNSLLEKEQTEYLVKNSYFMNHNPRETLRYISSSISYENFAREVIERCNPDLLISSHAAVEARIVARLCKKLNKEVIYLLSPFHEFKSVEPFEPLCFNSKYMVSGEYGKNKLVKKGISSKNIVIIGSQAFDEKYDLRKNKAKNDNEKVKSTKTILYIMQDIENNIKLFELLKKYTANRKDIKLILKFHPDTKFKSFIKYFSDFFNNKISFSINGDIEDLLAQADVLVTVSSIVILDALIIKVPVIVFKTSPFPYEIPFPTEKDVMEAHNYSELESNLDLILYDKNYRESWINNHKESHIKYIGNLDGLASSRVYEVIQKVLSSKYSLINST